jgi:tRNA(Ile)-lysidine synthase
MIDHFENILSVIGYFETRPTLAAAVSGGADSMALLLLADAWARAKNGKVIALTIDHHLRSESADEAMQVAAWCKLRGIEHHILHWDPPAKKTAIPEAARDARYELLIEWCKRHHVLHLLTAHHRGDQAETFFFRLARGSGLRGLACIPMVSYRNSVRLIRPLLDISKRDLQDFLCTQNQPWIEDPTNQNLSYTRNHIRHLLSQTPDEEMVEQRASALTQKFSFFRNKLENNEVRKLTSAIFLYPEGHAFIRRDAFLALEKDYALSTLTRLVQMMSDREHHLRSEKLLRLYEAMHDPLFTRRTLSHLFFTYRKKHDGFVVSREKSLRLEILTSDAHIHNNAENTPENRRQKRFKPAKSLGFGAFFSLNSPQSQQKVKHRA